MKDILSIGEFAKLRNVTTETLRHYDRVGLLKPVKIDPGTGYRYYSILQYEELGTIKELRQLGMSIGEIKKYFDNRNLKQSMELLRDKHNYLKEKIKKLQQLEESIDEKIKYMDEISLVSDFEEIVFKKINERQIITFNRPIKNEIELIYESIELENSLKEIAPIVASNRYGAIINNKDVNMFLFIKDTSNIDKKYIKKIPGGDYLCMYCKGNLENLENIQVHLEKMIKYIKKNEYNICGDILKVVQIDISVTDKKEEELFEIQIPVDKI